MTDATQPLLADFASKLKESADADADAARKDIIKFAEYVLRDKRGRKLLFKPFHKEILRSLPQHRLLLIEAFRGSGKTSLAVIAYSLWLIMKNRDVRIMILTASDVLAKTWLSHIELYMRSPQYMRLVGGNIIPGPREGLTWTNEEKIIRGRSDSATGYTLKAVGAGGQIRGFRTDVVICDDLISEGNSFTPYQRQVLSHFFHTSVLPTLDHYPDEPMSGQCVVIGTPLYQDDLMDTLKKEWAEETQETQEDD